MNIDMDFDKLVHLYEQLVKDNCSSYDVYAGEDAQALAEEKGISEETWFNDRVALQFGQGLIKKEMEKGIPNTMQEKEEGVRAFIAIQIRMWMKRQPNDLARKGLLLQSLQAAGAVDEEDLAMLSQYDISRLQNMVEDLAYQWTMKKVLPSMEMQCHLSMCDSKEPTIAVENAGALATAVYMEVPEMRQMPEVAGSASEAICECQDSSSTVEVLEKVSYALLLIAGAIAVTALLCLNSSIFAAAVAHVVTEGTFVGVVAAVTEEIAFVSGVLIKMMGAAMGTGILGGIVKAIEKMLRPSDTGHDNQENIEVDDTYVQV